MKNKSIISIFLILSIIIGIFSCSAISSSAISLARPTVNIINGGSTDGLLVKWNSVRNASWYLVAYRAKNSGGYGKGYSYYDTGNKTSVVLPKLKSGVCYEVQVRANANGNTSSWSYTRTMTFLERPHQINSYIWRTNNENRKHLYWSKIAGANSYQLVRWNVKNKRWDTIYVGSNNYFDDRQANYGSWKYQLRAMYRTKNDGTAFSYWSPVGYINWYPVVELNESCSVFKQNNKYYYCLYMEHMWTNNAMLTFKNRNGEMLEILVKGSGANQKGNNWRILNYVKQIEIDIETDRYWEFAGVQAVENGKRVGVMDWKAFMRPRNDTL